VVNEASRILAIGNPYEPSGPFYEACRSKVWHVIPISVFDTPNFTGEEVPARATDALVSPFWVEQQRALGLEGTPWWTAKVLGQFPDTASDQVVPLNLVELARTTMHVPDAKEADAAGRRMAAVEPFPNLGLLHRDDKAGVLNELWVLGRYHGQYHWSEGSNGDDDGWVRGVPRPRGQRVGLLAAPAHRHRRPHRSNPAPREPLGQPLRDRHPWQRHRSRSPRGWNWWSIGRHSGSRFWCSRWPLPPKY
jgi:hypothetical protein